MTWYTISAQSHITREWSYLGPQIRRLVFFVADGYGERCFESDGDVTLEDIESEGGLACWDYSQARAYQECLEFCRRIGFVPKVELGTIIQQCRIQSMHNLDSMFRS